jgi:hypothetical protein
MGIGPTFLTKAVNNGFEDQKNEKLENFKDFAIKDILSNIRGFLFIVM